MQNKPILKSSLDLVSRWCMDSGIQSKTGGFYSWYDTFSKEYAYLYSEITGYGITTLLYLNQLKKKEACIQKALKAAQWIMDNALDKSGGVRTRLFSRPEHSHESYSFEGGNIFAFDTGMVLYGFVNLYKETKNKKLLDAACLMADFLLFRIQKKDGSFFPVFNSFTSQKHESFDKWSNQAGAYHAKIGMGLIDLFEIEKNTIYRNAAERLCEFALTFQENSGRFITNTADKSTNLHPHCYAAEGLLYAGASLKIKKFVDASRRATCWLYDNLSPSGVNELFNPVTHVFSPFQRSDVLAQGLRLGAIFSMPKPKLDQLKSVLLEYQYQGDNRKQRGGFLYSKSATHINSWCSMFAMQALALLENKKRVSRNKKINLFI